LGGPLWGHVGPGSGPSSCLPSESLRTAFLLKSVLALSVWYGLTDGVGDHLVLGNHGQVRVFVASKNFRLTSLFGSLPKAQAWMVQDRTDVVDNPGKPTRQVTKKVIGPSLTWTMTVKTPKPAPPPPAPPVKRRASKKKSRKGSKRRQLSERRPRSRRKEERTATNIGGGKPILRLPLPVIVCPTAPWTVRPVLGSTAPDQAIRETGKRGTEQEANRVPRI
jgi:hypothetical protein